MATPSGTASEQTLIGQYRLLCHLASGGMAEVWIGEGPNSRNDPLVCVKLMLAGLERDQDFLSMFIEEARLAAPLAHPNLVQIDDLGVGDGRLFLAMEYVRGQPLTVLVRALQGLKEQLAPELAASLVAQAARGLHYAHDYCGPDKKPLGLVHRDVSPHNLILGFDGRARVVDFGIAKATSISGTRTRNLKGKVGYMSPEQVHGRGIDRRTDVFALGITLWELVTSQRLFSGSSEVEIITRIVTQPVPDPREHRPDLPEELAQITLRACARKLDQRYQSAGEVADDLERFARARLGGPVEQELAALAERVLPPLPTTVEEAREHAKTAPRSPSGISLAAVAPKQVGDTTGPPKRAHTTKEKIVDATRAIPDMESELPTAPMVIQPRPRSARGPAIWGALVGGIVACVLVPLFLWGRADTPKPRDPPPVDRTPADPKPVDPTVTAPLPDGLLTLRTNPWSEVFLGTRRLGNTPLVRVALPSGRQTLRLVNPKAGSFQWSVEIKPSEELDAGIVALDSLAPP